MIVQLSSTRHSLWQRRYARSNAVERGELIAHEGNCQLKNESLLFIDQRSAIQTGQFVGVAGVKGEVT